MKFKALFILLAVIGMGLLSCTDDEILTPNPVFKGNTDTVSTDTSANIIMIQKNKPTEEVVLKGAE